MLPNYRGEKKKKFGFGACRMLLVVSFIHFVVSSLSQLNRSWAWLTNAPHASTFECVRLCSEGKISLFSSEIILITISSAIRTKKNKNFGSCIGAIFHTYSYYNFNPCGIFDKMMSFSPIFNQELEQGKSMAALNSRK